MGDICNYIETLILLNLCRPLVVSTQNFDNEVVDYPIPRVANGQRAVLGQFPYQIALKQRIESHIYMTFCGAALIGPKKILTAAHCLEREGTFCERTCYGKKSVIVAKNRFAVAGTLLNKQDKSKRDFAEQWRKLSSALIPKEYRFPTDDIALVFTSEPFHFNKYVGSLPFAQTTKDYDDVMCIVSGYGRLSETQNSPFLMWAELKLMGMRECDHLHEHNMAKLICTASTNSTVLQGDSGGPLVCYQTTDSNDAGQGVIVGVVCGVRNPGGTFFTRVSSYRQFLEQNNASIPTINVACLCIIVSCYIKKII